jgi:molybdopterin-synthase adenylyltransferase
MSDERLSRNELLFGREAQTRLRQMHVAVVGLGGLGSHVVQQLAYLGVNRFTLVDHDVVEESNLNRLVGAGYADIGMKKVDIASRVIESIDPTVKVHAFFEMIEAIQVKSAVRRSDVIFGCVDRDLPRLELTDLSARGSLPYFDLASDTGDNRRLWYGGRVVFSNGSGCLSCLGLLDQEEMRRDLLSPEHRDAHDSAYGLDSAVLEGPGPSIVSVNGVVSSLAVTLFMEFVTGLSEPPRHLRYLGEQRVLRVSLDEPDPQCFYCNLWRASGQRSEPDSAR